MNLILPVVLLVLMPSEDVASATRIPPQLSAMKCKMYDGVVCSGIVNYEFIAQGDSAELENLVRDAFKKVEVRSRL